MVFSLNDQKINNFPNLYLNGIELKKISKLKPQNYTKTLHPNLFITKTLHPNLFITKTLRLNLFITKPFTQAYSILKPFTQAYSIINPSLKPIQY